MNVAAMSSSPWPALDRRAPSARAISAGSGSSQPRAARGRVERQPRRPWRELRARSSARRTRSIIGVPLSFAYGAPIGPPSMHLEERLPGRRRAPSASAIVSARPSTSAISQVLRTSLSRVPAPASSPSSTTLRGDRVEHRSRSSRAPRRRRRARSARPARRAPWCPITGASTSRAAVPRRARAVASMPDRAASATSTASSVSRQRLRSTASTASAVGEHRDHDVGAARPPRRPSRRPSRPRAPPPSRACGSRRGPRGPRAARLRAIGAPMIPVPSTATRIRIR